MQYLPDSLEDIGGSRGLISFPAVTVLTFGDDLRWVVGLGTHYVALSHIAWMEYRGQRQMLDYSGVIVDMSLPYDTTPLDGPINIANVTKITLVTGEAIMVVGHPDDWAELLN